MVAKAREIEILPGSELARAIDESLDAPIVVVKDGVRYRLEREPIGTSAGPDDAPIRADDDDDDRDALDRIVGSWADVDADALIEELRLAREGAPARDGFVRTDETDDYDPEAARQNLRRWAGTWAAVDVEALIENLYR